jgi:hypothetical protein
MYHKEKLSSHSSEGWNSELRYQHDWVLVRALLRVSDCQLFVMSSHGGKGAREPYGLVPS